jgi:hypothetical protein
MNQDGTTFAIHQNNNQTIIRDRASQSVADQLAIISRQQEAAAEARRTAPLSPEEQKIRDQNLANLAKNEAERNAIPESLCKQSDAPRISCPRCGEIILESQGLHVIGRLAFDGHGNVSDTRRTCVADIRRAVKAGRTIEKMLSDGLITNDDLIREGLPLLEQE